MQPLDADGETLPVFEVDRHSPFADDRLLVLADLIALRQVGIEIVLPVEHRLQIDRRLEPQPGAYRLPHAFGVDNRQHTWHRGIDQRHVTVGRATEFRRGAREQLRVRGDLRMHLHADDYFPVAGRAAEEVLAIRAHLTTTAQA